MDSTWKFMKWLWSYLQPYWYWLIGGLVGMVAYGASHGTLLYLVHEVAREIFEGDIRNQLTLEIPKVPLLDIGGNMVTVMEGTQLQILQAVLLLAIMVLIVEVIAELLSKLTMKILAQCVTRDIRSELYKNIIDRSLTFFESHNVGDLLSRVSADINQVQGSINSSVRDLVQAPLEVVFVLAVAVYAAPILAPAFIVIPLCVYIVIAIGKRVKKYSRQSQDVLGDILSLMQERFSGIKLVKALCAESEEKDFFNRKNQQFFRKLRRKIVADKIMKTVLHALIYTVGVLVFYIGGLLVFRWELLAPQGLVVFVASLFWAYKPLRKAAGMYTELQSARGAAERIDQIFSETRVLYSRLSAGNKKPEFKDKISFEDVSYHYPNSETPAINRVNLEIKRGRRIALVGPSGSGKSTLMDLLMRFYDPTSGQIKLDGVPLPEYDLFSLRRMFGLVTQDPVLFDASIAENIAYARDYVPDEEIRRAAEQAEALDFISRMPEGFETVIGERGVRLSGGEKQRITLARALVSNPRVLVLDEATSNVDSESERAIVEAIGNLADDLTVVAISHTLATVQHVDEIVVINRHIIEARGSHEELLKESATYQSLYNYQDIQKGAGKL
ncbi:MAG: ABC transporter ATP-binding protein [bacterium]